MRDVILAKTEQEPEAQEPPARQLQRVRRNAPTALRAPDSRCSAVGPRLKSTKISPRARSHQALPVHEHAPGGVPRAYIRNQQAAELVANGGPGRPRRDTAGRTSSATSTRIRTIRRFRSRPPAPNTANDGGQYNTLPRAGRSPISGSRSTPAATPTISGRRPVGDVRAEPADRPHPRRRERHHGVRRQRSSAMTRRFVPGRASGRPTTAEWSRGSGSAEEP